jgi:hypothetical protein
MFKALNGLSGLLLVDSAQALTIQIAVIVAYVVRRSLEDVASFSYPQRSAIVQPESLRSPSTRFASVSVVLRVLTFLLVAAPFFGLGPVTWVAAGILAIPMVLKLVEDTLPNVVSLNKWYPRGVFRFGVLLVVGVVVSGWVLGNQASAEQIKQTYAVILLPGMIFALIELFGREGWDWKESWIKRLLGILVWLAAVGIVTGLIQLSV